MRYIYCGDYHRFKRGHFGILRWEDGNVFEWVGIWKKYGKEEGTPRKIRFGYDEKLKEARLIESSRETDFQGRTLRVGADPFKLGLLPWQWDVEIAMVRIQKRDFIQDEEMVKEWERLNTLLP